MPLPVASVSVVAGIRSSSHGPCSSSAHRPRLDAMIRTFFLPHDGTSSTVLGRLSDGPAGWSVGRRRDGSGMIASVPRANAAPIGTLGEHAGQVGAVVAGRGKVRDEGQARRRGSLGGGAPRVLRRAARRGIEAATAGGWSEAPVRARRTRGDAAIGRQRHGRRRPADRVAAAGVAHLE